MHVNMLLKKVVVLFITSFYLLVNFSYAYYDPDRPINLDGMMEYDISRDAFKLKYFQKHPYGFFSVGCERTMKVIGNAPYDKDKNVINGFK